MILGAKDLWPAHASRGLFPDMALEAMRGEGTGQEGTQVTAPSQLQDPEPLH